MSGKIRSLVAPGYLFLCLVLGGSVQGVWNNFALQLIGLAILVWAAAKRGPLAETARLPFVVMLMALVTVGVQLVPLPPVLWTHFPGRSGMVAGYHLLNIPLPWLPISETPSESVATLFALLPPFGMIVAVLASDDDRLMASALLAATTASIALGALQVASGFNSGWYFYPITNSGAVGFFANSNHMGTLLLTAIPFVLALLLSRKSQHRLSSKKAALVSIAAITLGLILVGIALNRSMAALSLAVPVLLATGIMIPGGRRLRWIGAPAAALALIAGVLFLSVNPLSSHSAAQTKEISIQSRQAIWRTTGQAIADSFPAGTGLGSFQAIYPQHEDAESVDSTYVNHAHNDYLELTLELGLAGAVLIAVFLAWWALRAVQIWSTNLSSPFDRAATIASAAILAHSFVDYPLRTTAMAAVFAMCIAMMARRRSSVSTQARPASRAVKHVTIG